MKPMVQAKFPSQTTAKPTGTGAGAPPVYNPYTSVQRMAAPSVYRPNLSAQEQRIPARPSTAQLESVIQGVLCGFCGTSYHKPGCKHYKAKKPSHSGSGTHKPGMNHDDGSGFTHGGSGSEMHDHGLHAQAVHRKNKAKFGKKK